MMGWNILIDFLGVTEEYMIADMIETRDINYHYEPLRLIMILIMIIMVIEKHS